MTNPFDDLGNDEDDDTDVTAATPATDDDSSQPTSPPARTASEQASDDEPAVSGPAFEYSAVRQRPLYARGETWDALEDQLGLTVTPELRRMGIRDDETREVHDALLKVALEHIDEVPEQILETRRQA
ncbi:hypothetical protein [Natronorubrum sulfidifaciens]|uniref:Uncharacterized protein n=1 Tax=Natronorubrum sulfidifaciens JCM 14089 TaxID=1230460 RepID=L9VTZ4_9EURY|nr:hypothetical protein [Natronorubrum sulfidifaciens]ELY40680.1 hypothetical protein C495_17217 [Natronorubrum sulfidifaciens JCM 14089]